MTNDQSKDQLALHTILAHCIKPFHPVGETDTPMLEQMQNRLDEIEVIASIRVKQNAEENVGQFAKLGT